MKIEVDYVYKGGLKKDIEIILNLLKVLYGFGNLMGNYVCVWVFILRGEIKIISLSVIFYFGER